MKKFYVYDLFARIMGAGYPFLRVLFLLGVVSSFLIIQFASAQASGVSSAICTIFRDITSVIFVLALTLVILGGTLYAGANLLPAQTKGAMQGYGMSMVVGGVVGIIIVLAAPFILNQVILAAGANAANPTGATFPATTCST